MSLFDKALDALKRKQEEDETRDARQRLEKAERLENEARDAAVKAFDIKPDDLTLVAFTSNLYYIDPEPVFEIDGLHFLFRECKYDCGPMSQIASSYHPPRFSLLTTCPQGHPHAIKGDSISVGRGYDSLAALGDAINSDKISCYGCWKENESEE